MADARDARLNCTNGSETGGNRRRSVRQSLRNQIKWPRRVQCVAGGGGVFVNNAPTAEFSIPMIDVLERASALQLLPISCRHNEGDIPVMDPQLPAIPTARTRIWGSNMRLCTKHLAEKIHFHMSHPLTGHQTSQVHHPARNPPLDNLRPPMHQTRPLPHRFPHHDRGRLDNPMGQLPHPHRHLVLPAERDRRADAV